jgi:hypothetical protein
MPLAVNCTLRRFSVPPHHHSDKQREGNGRFLAGKNRKNGANASGPRRSARGTALIDSEKARDHGAQIAGQP